MTTPPKTPYSDKKIFAFIFSLFVSGLFAVAFLLCAEEGIPSHTIRFLAATIGVFCPCLLVGIIIGFSISNEEKNRISEPFRSKRDRLSRPDLKRRTLLGAICIGCFFLTSITLGGCAISGMIRLDQKKALAAEWSERSLFQKALPVIKECKQLNKLEAGSLKLPSHYFVFDKMGKLEFYQLGRNQGNYYLHVAFRPDHKWNHEKIPKDKDLLLVIITDRRSIKNGGIYMGGSPMYDYENDVAIVLLKAGGIATEPVGKLTIVGHDPPIKILGNAPASSLDYLSEGDKAIRQWLIDKGNDL